MKYDKAGEYTLVYKATDECGNTTEQIRNVVVEEVTPTERLLLRGGAEDVCAFEGSTDIAIFTPVFTEPYDGLGKVIFTNFRAKVGDGEWVSYPSYERIKRIICVSANDFSYDDIDLENGDYIFGGSSYNWYAYENSDDVRCAKWDSLEIWTKAGE